ncbi:MAG: hypothetical protein E7Z87_06650 [Cyanobacteria bacterium SIG26]|nr:hypothetical protein [Cyanobacteria bacterium SIG26]
MEFDTPKIIKDLEFKIETSYSLPIFRGYKAVDKRGVEQIIDTIYATLPEDVKKAREYLQTVNYEIKNTEQRSKVYDFLNKFELFIERAVPFANFVIINIKETENLIKEITNNLPEELTKVNVIKKQ